MNGDITAIVTLLQEEVGQSSILKGTDGRAFRSMAKINENKTICS